YLPFLPMIAIFAVAAIGQRTWIYAALALLFVGFIAKEMRGFRDQTGEEITMIRQVLRLTRPGESLMDIKGETIFRRRPSYHIFEFITRNQMLRGMIADTVPEDVVAKRCYVAQADGGARVRVVFATDGESNAWPQRFTHKKLVIRKDERARWGAMRREEALEALARLGVERDAARFLGFPDQKIAVLARAGCPKIL